MRCWGRARLLLLAPWLLVGCETPSPVPAEPPSLNPDLVQRGAFVFVAARGSGDGQRSCATCHPGGGSNGLTYRAGALVESRTPGARNVPALRGLWQTPPYLWDGSLGDVRSVLERMLAVEMDGATLVDYDLAALEAYVLAFEPFDRGRLEPDGGPVEPATLASRRGASVYTRAGCDACHPAPIFALPERHDMGTGAAIDIPTLRGLSSTPPYGHDGRWPDLEDVTDAMLQATDVELNDLERRQLIEYLKLF